MRTTFNIGFVCRKSKVSKSGKAPVEMSIIINGKRTYLVLPRKEDPEIFQKLISSRRMNPLKEYLEQMYQKVLTAQTELLKEGRVVCALTIKDYLQNGCSSGYTVEELFRDYLKIMAKKCGVSLSCESYRRYELVRDSFFRHFGKDRQVSDITNAVVSDFYAELNKKYESTTAAGMMAKLKAFIRFGIDNDKIKVNPFSGIKITKKTKEVEFLTDSEIRIIKEKDFNGRLDKIRDLFLFQCYTGLAYTDMAHLSKSDYQKNGSGQVYIKKHRQKTGICFLTVLFDDALRIAEKYGYELPVLSNQKYNSYLKEIRDLCGITKPLHTHIGRHTAATYLLNRGLPIETVSKIMGHTNIKQTQHYAKLLDDSVFREFRKLEARLIITSE